MTPVKRIAAASKPSHDGRAVLLPALASAVFFASHFGLAMSQR